MEIFDTAFSELSNYRITIIELHDGVQSEQTQLFIKVVGAINYVTSVSKKKPTRSRIQKRIFKNTIDIQDGLLEILLEQREKRVLSLTWRRK